MNGFWRFFWRDGAWPKDQMITFWWRSRSGPGFGFLNPDQDPDPEFLLPSAASLFVENLSICRMSSLVSTQSDCVCVCLYSGQRTAQWTSVQFSSDEYFSFTALAVSASLPRSLYVVTCNTLDRTVLFIEFLFWTVRWSVNGPEPSVQCRRIPHCWSSYMRRPYHIVVVDGMWKSPHAPERRWRRPVMDEIGLQSW